MEEKWWIKWERVEEVSWEGGGRREDERWLDGLSFDPSLSDAPLSALTETTWGIGRGGRLRGRLCVCLLAPVGEGGAGVSLIYGRLSAWQPSTLG